LISKEGKCFINCHYDVVKKGNKQVSLNV
jgi:hypothetical protein